MPVNYVLLEKIVVGAASVSSVTFSGIPQTGYTDLVIKGSARGTSAAIGRAVNLTFNSSGSSKSCRVLYSDGTTPAGATYTNNIWMLDGTNAANATSNTFSSFEVYIPNYASSNYKSMSIDNVTENSGTFAQSGLTAGLWSNTAAITSITFTPEAGSFDQHSAFYLYGIAKLNTTPIISPYATGGNTIMTDGTYWYHAFRSSGTFTPGKSLSCDVLVVAGGGSGGADSGGGGGAGGVIAFASQSLASGTGYTATIGAGGAARTSSSAAGNSGSNSQFASLTAAVGGGAGGSGAGGAGSTGGSGGGNRLTGNAGTSGQGNAGAGGVNFGDYPGGGGGGAGGAGTAGVSSTGGTGGAGTNSVTNWGALSSMLTATGLGVSGYIAGGGGGGSVSGTPGSGGSGGATAGTTNSSSSSNATANTGSGSGGGGGNPSGFSGNGGSGIVIIRYAV